MQPGHVMEGLPSAEAAVAEMESRMMDSRLSNGIPSEQLLGALPIRRLIPQDVHSLMDYGNAGFSLVSSMIVDDEAARAACLALGATVGGVSLCTDYRLSLVRLVPIKMHEISDYIFGFSCIAAPFLLGYAKREPLVSAFQVLCGVTTVFASMFTDYRAYRGK